MTTRTMPMFNMEHAMPFSSLLRLIVTQNSAAVKELKNITGTKVEEIKNGGFLYYKGQDSSDSCDCWYELEYFEFVRGKTVVTEILDRVCENLHCGKCKHVLDCEKAKVAYEEYYHHCSTTLINAAAATGNKHVLKFLASRKEWLHNRPSRTGIWPINVAVIKGQHRVMKYLYTNLPAMKTAYDMFTEDNRFYNRANCLPKKQPLHEHFDKFYNPIVDLAEFLCAHKITNINVLTGLIANLHLDSNTSLGFLLYCLLFSRASEIVTALLCAEAYKSKKIQKSQPAKMIIVCCILTDDGSILQTLIAKNFDIACRQYGYNLLDIAAAFGSKNCVAILQSYMKTTENIYTETSPFNILQLLGRDFPGRMYLTSFLSKCADQGFSVNEIDASGQTPLHLALKLKRDDVARELLKLGADVNILCRDQTAINLLLKCAGWKGMWNLDMLKKILYRNPVPELTKNTLHEAVLYDLNNMVPETLKTKTVLKLEQQSGHLLEDGMQAESIEDRFLALSAFALLRELGFNSMNSYVDYLLQDLESLTRLAQNSKSGRVLLQKKVDAHNAYLKLVLNATSQPRSLQSSCSIAIRRAHPGGRLHKYVAGLTLPRSLKTFIVHPYILWQTVVK